MALTRAQYLQGDSGQGNVLLGQVQGVKQGPGTAIASDGTISVDASTVVGLVKLNNTVAYNSYVWPSTSGSATQFLMSDGAGNLSWQSPRIGASVVVSDNAPTSPVVGQLWYDCTERILKVYEDCGISPMWTPVSRGQDAEVANVTSVPDFQGGEGSEAEPFNLLEISTLAGTFVRFGEVITVTGFAPYQYVPITDLNAELNGNRFSASSYFSDGNGVLTFRVLFTDYPATVPGNAYSALLEIGFGSFFVNAPVSISAALSLSSAGNITGTPSVGQTLNYSVGQADGGTPPYSYTWEWRRSSDQAILQTNGESFVLPESVDNDRIFVQLQAVDANGTVVTGSTGAFPTSPTVITKGAFPATTVLFPTALDQEVSTLWLDPGTTLLSDGCIEITTDGSIWGQGPFSISNGGTLQTRWISNAGCGDSPQGATISGCVFSSSYRECGSLTIDRIPSPFSFVPVGEIQLNAVATAIPITPVGYNSTAYITYSGLSTLTGIQGSLDNGASWANIPVLGTDSFQIRPGQSLIVRGTTGSSTGTAYNAIINIGQGQSVQSATFTATTTTQTTFTTQINFPSTTSQGYSVTQPGGSSVAIPGAASASWVDGSTTITATGCLEIQVENSSGGVISAWGSGPFAIANTNVLLTRWKTTSVCGGAVHGAMITGTVTNVPAGGSKTSQGQLMVDRVVGSYDFSNLTGQNINTQVTSNTVSLTGYNATTYLTASGDLTSLQASVNGGTWTSIPSSGTSFAIQPVGPNTTPPTLQIRGTTGGSTSTTYEANISIGDAASSITGDNWRATTSEAVKTVLTPSILTPTNGAKGINPTSLNPPGVNVTSSTYQVINGASATQLNSEWEVRSGSTSGPVVYTEVKTSNFFSWFIPLSANNTTLLVPNTNYFVRVRYTSADSPAVVSSWSPFTQFTTATTFTQQWALRKTWSGWTLGYNSIANNGSLWMALSGEYASLFGPDTVRVTRSSDGINWTEAGSITNSSFFNTGDLTIPLAYGNGVWLTVGVGGSDVKRSSNDGSSWVSPTASGVTSSRLRSLAFGNGTFVAVGDNGVIQTTTDGTVFVSRSSGTTNRLSSIIWNGSQFVAAGSGKVLYSSTGTTWSRFNTPVSFNPQIVYLPGSTPQYLIVRPYPDNSFLGNSVTAYYSTNLSSWTQVTLPISTLGYAAAGNGVFVIGDWSGSSIKVWSSPTGLTGTWTQQPFPSSKAYYHAHYLNYGTTSTGIGRFVLIDHNWNIFSTN